MNNRDLKNSAFYSLLHCAFTTHNISHARFEASGNSMHPFIRNRDTILLHSVVKKATIKVGDIVAVGDRKKNQLLFIHRVVGISPGLCMTKGDNSQKSDGWVPFKDILGVVVKIKRVSGKTYRYKRWQNFIIAISSKYGVLNNFIVPAASFLGKLLKPSKTRV